MTNVQPFCRAVRSVPLSTAFVTLATLTGACFRTSFDLRWANVSFGYIRLTIASDVAKGGLPPLVLGTVIALIAHRLGHAAPGRRDPVARGRAFVVAAAIAGVVFGTLVTAISRVVTGTLFVF